MKKRLASDIAPEQFEPSQIAKYVINLSQAFNKYYGSVRILTDDTRLREVRLSLVAAVAIVLRDGLRLLGMTAQTRCRTRQSVRGQEGRTRKGTDES